MEITQQALDALLAKARLEEFNLLCGKWHDTTEAQFEVFLIQRISALRQSAKGENL